MYYGSALLLFTNVLTGHCMSGHWTLLMYKISDYGFWDNGIQTEERERRQEELEKWTFCHISHISGPILTKC